MDKQSHLQGESLDRYLRPADAWAMAFGCMVGWGAFVMPGTTFLPVAGAAGTILALAIGAGVMLIVGVSFSYLMTRNAGTGGIYTYVKEAFGRDHAFLCSWFLCLSYLTIVFLNGSALFLVIRLIFGNRVTNGITYTIAGNQISLIEVLISVCALAGVGVLFMVAKPVLQRLNTILAFLLLAGTLIVGAVCLPHALDSNILHSFGMNGTPKAFGVASLVILAPWAFVGFEIISFDTAHFRFPAKKTKWIVLTSILVAALAYISMVLVSISVLPDGFISWGDYIDHLSKMKGIPSVPTFYAAQAFLGKAGLAIIAIASASAILTGIICAYRAMVRVLSTMAEDRILSEKFTETSYSILFIMVLSIVISLLGRNTLIWFVDLTSWGAIVAYGYTSSAAYRIAKQENNRKIAAVGLAGAVISAIFGIVQMVPGLIVMETMGAEDFLLLSLWCLLGFVFYWRTVNRSQLTEYSGLSVSGMILFALLEYSAVLWFAKTLAAMDSVTDIHRSLIVNGILLLLIIFAGLTIMLYIQDLVRKKHEAAEREKIRAVEGSLAKSQFLFNMSHDIRTPMNAIIGYTHLAEEEGSPEVVREYLGKIESSSQHLLSLINDVLEMSRIESGKVELEYLPMDLTAAFSGLRDLFGEQMKQKDLDFAIHTTRVRDRYVWCDRRNLDRVLLNLVSNAYKFTPEGGRITVTVSETGAADDGYGAYEILVQDTGIGMSREFAEKMFTAFERERSSTDSGIQGTGLGLAITKSIVDLMGGTIDVLTSPGSGTEIIIRLKLRLADEEEVAAETKETSGRDAPQTDFSSKRLLLVEDNEINMEIAKMILSQQGFEVETAENGQIAVDKVKEAGGGHYDAVLMDIQMPVMDGYAAARAIRALDDPELAGIPILAMTANAFKEDEQAALEAGMQAHVAKPIDVPDLMAKLAAVFGDETE